MAYIEIDVDLGDFSGAEIARYVAGDDELFELVLKERDKLRLSREGESAKIVEADYQEWVRLHAPLAKP